MTEAPQYAFTFAVIASDREGYYYDDWHKAKRYEVVGKDKAEALKNLWALLGDPPNNRFWKADQVGTARDVRLTGKAGS